MNSLALQRISKGSGRKNRLRLGREKKNVQAYSGIEVRNERVSDKFKLVCSPELKMAKVCLLSTLSSILFELGSEKSLLKEHMGLSILRK